VADYVAPAGCPDRAAFLGELEQSLGRAVPSPSETEVRTRVELSTTPDGDYRLTLRTQAPDEAGTRELFESSCDVLVQAAVLLVALAIDPIGVVYENERRETRLPANPTAPTTAAKQNAPGSAEVSRPARPMLRGHFDAAALVGAGQTPRIAPGLEVAAGLGIRQASVEVLGRYWFATSARFRDRPDSGVDVSAWTVGVRPCYRPQLVGRRVEVPVCGLVEAGALVGVGVARAEERTGHVTWAAIGASLGLTYLPRPWIGLFVAAEGALALLRPTFEIGGLGTAFRPAPITARGALGLSLRFP
jgi:hypothetical protein